jgi:Bacterial SH3 domain
MPASTPSTFGSLTVTASALNVRNSPSLTGDVIGSLPQGRVVTWLSTSRDGYWAEIRSGRLRGWSSLRYLAEEKPAVPSSPFDEILSIAEGSEIRRYRWKNRGIAPPGYIMGMAMTFGRVYCKLLAGDPAAIAIAAADSGEAGHDALAHYASQFRDIGLNNEASGPSTLRHLFVLLIGLGMRESSGRHCEGRDLSATNTTSDTAEAGLFQTSYNARVANDRAARRLLAAIINHYQANPASGFAEIFAEGVTCKPREWENFGSGPGREFQQLSKECPAFAGEFAALTLRHLRKHWGPINRREVELHPACNAMLLKIQQTIDASGLCPVLI